MENRRKTYSELITFSSLKERLDYLKCPSLIGDSTLGGHRYLVQKFYGSVEWKEARRKAIVRDGGCELGLEGCEIPGTIIVHHINPITVDDLLHKRSCLTDQDNLVCSSSLMHSAIHYESDVGLAEDLKERKPNDTCPWRT